MPPAHNTHPSLVGHHTHHATHGDTNGVSSRAVARHRIVGSAVGTRSATAESSSARCFATWNTARSSLVVPSAAIKVPNLTREVFIARRTSATRHPPSPPPPPPAPRQLEPRERRATRRGGRRVVTSSRHPPPPPRLGRRRPGPLAHPPPGFTNCVDSDWLGFFNDNNRVPGAHVDAVEDDGYDVFIRPGSLIFGVHSQSAVPGVSQGAAEMLRTAAEHAGDDGVITRAVTRSRTGAGRSGAVTPGREEDSTHTETPTRIPRTGPGALTVPTTRPTRRTPTHPRGRLRVVQRRDLQAGARPGDGRGEHRARAGRPRGLTSQRAHRRGIGAGHWLVHGAADAAG